MPIETHDIRYALTQELMHAVQMDMDALRNGFNGPLGETVLTVGLAMRGTERILPRAPKSLYTWRNARWLARCTSNSSAILRGIRPYIAKADSDTASRFNGRLRDSKSQRHPRPDWPGPLVPQQVPRLRFCCPLGVAPPPTHQLARGVPLAKSVRNLSPRRTWVANVSTSILLPQTMTPTRLPRSVLPNGPISAANAAAPPGSTASLSSRNRNAIAPQIRSSSMRTSSSTFIRHKPKV